MGSELLLWRNHWRKFSRSSSDHLQTRWLLGSLIIGALGLLMVGFFTAGTASQTLEYRYNWVALGVIISLVTGFFFNIAPRQINKSLLLLPLARHDFLWDALIGSLRYPALISLVVILPYYIGSATNSYYGHWEYVLLFKAVIFLPMAAHLVGYVSAEVIKHFTKHFLSRLISLAIFCWLLVYLFLNPITLLSAFDEAVNSVTWSEVSLLLLGSLGVVGVAVALLELVPARLAMSRVAVFWETLTRQRNFRVVFGLGEASFTREMFFILRSAHLHQRLAVILLLHLLLTWLTSDLTPALSEFTWIILGVTVGLFAFMVSFKGGQRLETLCRDHFSLPISRTRTVLGTFGITAVVSTFLSLVAIEYSLGRQGLESGTNVAILVIAALAVHSLAFNIGRFVERQNSVVSDVDRGYALLIVGASVLLLSLTVVLLRRAGIGEALAVTLMWSLFYSFGSAYLLRRPQTRTVT